MKNILLYMLVLFFTNAQAQKNASTFVLKGSINSDSGTIVLMPINDSLFYPTKANYETVVQKGNFLISGYIKYPYGFEIGLRQNGKLIYLSDVFYIDSGVKKIVCDTNRLREIPVIENVSMYELKEDYLAAYNPIFFKALNASQKQIKRESILFEYVKTHPNSYVALWKLVRLLTFGYENSYDSIFAQFSENLKKTHTGKLLAKKLQTASAIRLGKIFPNLIVSDLNKKYTGLLNHVKKSHFTLIDFWFSACAPCVSQFPYLKDIYLRYHNKGFNIIGVSVDIKEKTSSWKSSIIDYKLPWIQYIDLNGIKSKKLSITAYPSNFLLDSTGKIIAKNLSTHDLETWLTEKLD